MAAKTYKMRLKKGDTVMIRSGKFKGRTGKVVAVYPKLNQVAVEGINVVKRHRKPTQLNPQGGIQEITKPVWAGKVGLYDSTAKKASRVGYRIAKAGQKSRLYKSSGKEVK